MQRAFIPVDLGYGDASKGAITKSIAAKLGAVAIFKVGGGQGGHGVIAPNGKKITLGCIGVGVVNNIPTHIAAPFVLYPQLLIEEVVLVNESLGIENLHDLITIDENVLVATPFHAVSSRLNELFRTRGKHTSGVGVGNAYQDSLTHPQDAIRMRDLRDGTFLDKLNSIANRMRKEYADEMNIINKLEKSLRPIAKGLRHTLQSTNEFDATVRCYERIAKQFRIITKSQVQGILRHAETIVFEGSQGVLIDRHVGFHPYTTKIKTTPDQAIEYLKSYGYEGRVITLGITRTFQVRHGNGPMVTENKGKTGEYLPEGEYWEQNWNGGLRAGPLDFVALRYAIRATGGLSTYNGLAVTWVDTIMARGIWEYCDRYEGKLPAEFFENGEITFTRFDDEADQFAHQKRLGEALNQCKPIITTIDCSGFTKDQVSQLIQSTFKQKLGVDVRILSFGPADNDKVFL